MLHVSPRDQAKAVTSMAPLRGLCPLACPESTCVVSPLSTTLALLLLGMSPKVALSTFLSLPSDSAESVGWGPARPARWAGRFCCSSSWALANVGKMEGSEIISKVPLKDAVSQAWFSQRCLV